jgi:hypothetical protein
MIKSLNFLSLPGVFFTQERILGLYGKHFRREFVQLSGQTIVLNLQGSSLLFDPG